MESLAGEDFSWDAIFEFTIKNASLTVSQVDKIRQSMDKLADTGKITEDQYQQVDRTLGRGRGASTANKGVKELTTSLNDLEGNLSRQRYALYDVASTYGVLSAALLATAGYAVKVGADFESAFTAVDRTLEDGQAPAAIAQIRAELVNLSTTIPKSFAEISEIATLGNQLGIAAKDLTTFTETVAQFSAITGITADASAQAFGRIGNILGVLPGDYDKLASAIVFVGRNSAATEKQIITLTERLGASASRAGLTADEVVGLSGALAGLAVAPERAQGVFENYFNTLNKAVSEGGEALDNFSTITGKSNEEITRLVTTGQGLPLLIDLLRSIESANTVEVTSALSALGLTGLRVNEVLPRLAGGISGLEKALADSSKAYQEATELATQYGKISDDLNTQFKLLVNSVNALIEELSGGLVPGIAGAVSGLTDLVNVIREFAKNPAAQTIAAVTIALSTGIGVYLAYRTAVVLTIASTYALTTSQASLAGASGISAVRGALALLIPALGGATVATTAATAATTATAAASSTAAAAAAATAAAISATTKATLGYTIAQANAARAMGISAVASIGAAGAMGTLTAGTVAATIASRALVVALPVLAIAALAVGLGSVGQASIAASGGLKGIATGGNIAGKSVLELNAAFVQAETLMRNLQASQDSLGALGGVAAAFNAQAMQEASAEIEAVDAQFAALVQSGNAQQVAFLLRASGYSAAEAAELLPQYTKALAEAAATGLSALGALAGSAAALQNGTGGATALAAKVSDVGKAAGGAAKQVRTLVDYANDLSSVFSRAFDIRFGAQSAIDEVTTSFTNLTDRIEEARRALSRLVAERGVQEYFLSIAEAYGDNLRADVIRSDIADLNAEIAETQAEASTELTGNSKAAIRNRKEVTALVKQYEDYISALAASGADQATLNAAVNASRAQFLAQAQALGYSNTQLQPYIASFKDMATTINQIPRNITVAFNGNPALQAINEFMAKARTALGASIPGPTVDDSALKKAARGAAIYAQIQGLLRNINSPNINSTAKSALESELYRLNNMYNSGSYASGGYTGRGGKYEPAGVVHRGEYVVPKQHVNQRTGLPYADAMGRMQRGAAPSSGGYANGGFVRGMSGVVDMGAWERRILNKIAENTGRPFMLGLTPITDAVNSTNRSSFSRGAA